jgi:SWIM zinc finger
MKSLAHPAHPAKLTRELRALELYRAHHRDIERLCRHIYLVPSCTEEGPYRVDYFTETCNCPGFDPALACKHVLAVGIHRAKRRGAMRRSLEALEEQLQHEIMDDEERQALRDRVLRLRRRLSR